MAGRFAAARVAVLVAGGGGKMAYCGASVILYSSGVGNGWLLATGVADVFFAVLFAAILLRGDRI
jgi:hypothetical protein